MIEKHLKRYGVKSLGVDYDISEEAMIERYSPTKEGWKLIKGIKISIMLNGKEIPMFMSFYADGETRRTAISAWESGALVTKAAYGSPEDQVNGTASVVAEASTKYTLDRKFNYDVIMKEDAENLKRIEKKLGKKPAPVGEGVH